MDTEIRIVGVLGAGTMGHGIAQAAAMAGYTTRLYDVDEAAAQAGLVRVRQNLDKGVARGKVTEDARAATLERLTATADLPTAAEGAGLVIEAAPERMELKKTLFRQVSEMALPWAILGTNTSSLSVTEIATAATTPEHVIGMHFFNPVHIMKLLEVVRAEQTADVVVGEVRGVAARMGKEVIVVRDFAGFATSRLGLVIGLEAMRMLEQGVASAEDIDRAMVLGYRHPMGPLRLTDLVGLDVRLAIAEHLHREVGEQFRPPQILRRLVRAGQLGKKTGQGFYAWDDAR